MRITYIIERAEEGGFWAKVPGLPGCYTQAETREELRANVKDAIEGWLAVAAAEAAEAGAELEEVEA